MNGSETDTMEVQVTETVNAATTIPARVALVDDHPLFRRGLRTVLESDPRVNVVAELARGSELLERARVEQIDVTVLDLVLPGEPGTRIAAELLKLQPTTKILALSMLDDPIRISEALRHGAGGFALKSQPVEEIVEAIHLVLGGVRYLPPTISRAQIDEMLSYEKWPLERLTTREREVFELLVQGHGNDEIAARLFIARRTVEAHRHHVMHKLGARSLVDLVRLAIRHGVPGI
jgi:DNA-binding NarL/FixJ family response regulator